MPLKTKIVCTIGPACNTPEKLRGLIEGGMSIARLNFSHGSHEDHQRVILTIRRLSEEMNRPIAILQDLCGPKIRVGQVVEPGVRLEPGQDFTLTTETILGDSERASISYPELPRDVRPGDVILLADGMLEMRVMACTDTEIRCRVDTGGFLTSHKGVNVPTGTLKVDAITEKDKKDLRFGLENDVDYVALSFVRTAEDILKLKYMIEAEKKDTPVIAKIEKHEALTNIDDIMTACDGIMVARGDLGVEIPLEHVPGIQKMLVKKASEVAKPVIIATQMLRSMVQSPRPSRAEATDVANAVLDGADAVMLSEETASGDYPVEAVRFLTNIIEHAEKDFPHDRFLGLPPRKNVPESVSHASCVLADHLDARAIVATTRTGFTAMQISRFRPRPMLIALSPDLKTVRRLCLYWGCLSTLVDETRDTDERIEKASIFAVGSGNVKKGDLIVLITGHPVWAAGTTNMMRVMRL